MLIRPRGPACGGISATVYGFVADVVSSAFITEIRESGIQESGISVGPHLNSGFR